MPVCTVGHIIVQWRWLHYYIRWQKSTLCHHIYYNLTTLGLHAPWHSIIGGQTESQGKTCPKVVSMKQCLEYQLANQSGTKVGGGGGGGGLLVGRDTIGGTRGGAVSHSPIYHIHLVLRFKNTHYHASLPSHTHIFIMVIFQSRHFLIPGDKMTRVWGRHWFDIILFS